MKIVFVPIDNRPVCFQMPEMIARINNNIDLIMPPLEFLGGLKTPANTDKLEKWLRENVRNADCIILSLDTIAYGGLIPSRRSNETFEDILNRINRLKDILSDTNAKIYAFSSIMRISNNNINEEEKEYWNLYGKKIFQYSFNKDKFKNAETDIPQEILDDYLSTRKRNFEINKIYLNWYKNGLFDTLIFSKDDCAEYGLNVQEARELERLGGFTKTGADEIPLTLLSGAIPQNVTVCPIYAEPEYKNLISNYEDISIEQSVKGQLELSGCNITNKDDADIILYVNNFKDHQGEIVMKRETELFSQNWNSPDKPYIIADVRNANGADNNFVEKFLNNGYDTKFLGYSAWNTSANTLGSLICAMKIAITAKNTGNYDDYAFKKFQAVRLLDDWAYQANIRQILNNPDKAKTKELMEKYEEKVKDFLGIEFSTEYSFPWNRLFEVKIELS